MAVRDVAIPLAYPDYAITVDTPRVDIQLPKIPFGRDFFPTAIHVKPQHEKVPHLGHAGILFFSASGLTKYFEYGRYDVAEIGLTRRIAVPDLVIDRSAGRPTRNSLTNCLKHLSRTAGQNGRIDGAYIELESGKFSKMLAYCQLRIAENSNPKRQRYSLTEHSCIHFARDVLQAAGVSTPLMIDPRPIGYIEKLEDGFPSLTFAQGLLAMSGVELPATSAARTASTH